MIELYNYQRHAVENAKSGSILRGGVGSGKSRTALAYYILKECKGDVDDSGVLKMKEPKNLYIITTARKRDTLEWDKECSYLSLFNEQEDCPVKYYVDSWNNISKYCLIENSFFIFDEQRAIGSGTWVKSFLTICKKNRWIMLSATPGDTWMDYIPVFIANGFYKNRSDFLRQHVVFNRFSKYPKVDYYINCEKLIWCRNQILIPMRYYKKTEAHHKDIKFDYDSFTYSDIVKNRWNLYTNKPIRDASEYCSVLRRIVNSGDGKIKAVYDVLREWDKIIIFYNFDYELEILRDIGSNLKRQVGEWNGHKHEPIPTTDKWIYLVQYSAGAEGWNCIETNAILFYSPSYSYKMMVQAAGRIDRLNTPFNDLYYFYLKSDSSIEKAIFSTLEKKKDFNEKKFFEEK